MIGTPQCPICQRPRKATQITCGSEFCINVRRGQNVGRPQAEEYHVHWPRISDRDQASLPPAAFANNVSTRCVGGVPARPATHVARLASS